MKIEHPNTEQTDCKYNIVTDEKGYHIVFFTDKDVMYDTKITCESIYMVENLIRKLLKLLKKRGIKWNYGKNY